MEMSKLEKVFKGFAICSEHGLLNGEDCHGHYEYTDNFADIIKANDYSKQCPYNGCETGCVKTLAKDTLAMLKEDCHNCKLECLLQKYDELKEKYDKLLKEQEPTTFNPHYIDEYGKHFICGVECGSCHEKISRTYHYCPYCGKELKWE